MSGLSWIIRRAHQLDNRILPPTCIQRLRYKRTRCQWGFGITHQFSTSHHRLKDNMITLYSHKAGPNGWKVAIVLEELGLKYETKYLDFQAGEQKAPEHTKFNPNGRIPTIIDHDNNDFVLWESNSIIKYLVDRYDKDNKIHFAFGSREYYETDQFMNFQASGQGPYFGQAAWFGSFHSEKIPSAVERYQKEIIRVLTVLDGVLADKKYLVGEKPSIADFVFIPWNKMLGWLLSYGDNKEFDEQVKKLTNFQRWFDDITARESVKKVYAVKESVSK